MLRKWGMLVVMLLVAPTLAFAQNTGKIAGRVTDSGNGEGLPGVNVVLVGTTYGSITDVDGNYFILGVPVGTYDVQASFVGFQTETVTGVDVSSGYTKEINFNITEGVELSEIVVEYERPLIQKDAVGAPKIVSGEEIVNLPVRGAASVAKIQAGVVSQEGSNTLNIRGGRGSEVTYYIDGVKVIGTTAIPQSAIQEQEMMIGNLSARYGDAMSGVISITTKSGGRNFFGSIEGITSEALDSFGYNLVSATAGGPIGSDKLNFFLAGEYLDQADDSPRSKGLLQLNDGLLDDLTAAPTALLGTDADGKTVLLPIPGSLAEGTTIPADHGHVTVNESNQIVLSDGTTIDVPEGVDPTSITNSVAYRGNYLTDDDFTRELKKPGTGSNRLSLNGNMTFELFDGGRFRLGGRYNTSSAENSSTLTTLFSPDSHSLSDADEFQIYGTWTQHLSNSTFYQVQADYTDRFSETYDPRFGTGFDDFLRYGNGDDEATFAAIRNYKSLTNQGDSLYVIMNSYGDASAPGNGLLAGLVGGTGGGFYSYSKTDQTQFRLSASATTQLGLNQLEFGAEYETRTTRNFNLSAASLARYVNDGTDVSTFRAADGSQVSIESYDDIPIAPLSDFVSGYGYDLTGRNEVDSESISGQVATTTSAGEYVLDNYNEKPYQPIYYGGYVQDKIEFRDIVLNMGIRVDIFDNNTLVLKDLYARRPIIRAGDISGAPAGIGSDYAVYYDPSGTNVIGYRDLDGTFYNAGGETVVAGDILLNGSPIRVGTEQITDDMFEDYKPQVTLMPRIGVSFPVTDRALFFASYGVVSQRPSDRNFQSIDGFLGNGGINNNNLKPEKTTKYELGFRQRLGDRTALTISGFFHQIEDLIQLSDLRTAFPNGYSTYINSDFGTVKGAEIGFDLRRTNGLAANLNYTLSFADGTGSSSTTTSTIVWIDETPPNFISPLDFDQRHKFNASLDYRLGNGEGPMVGGKHILANFGVNLLATGGSGLPYTAHTFPRRIGASIAPKPKGGINGSRAPFTSRIDLKLDRRFPLGASKSSVTAFLWVENLLDQTNVQSVYNASGLAYDDGYLNTPDGQQFLQQSPIATETLYRYRLDSPYNYGFARRTRLGLRLDF